MLMQHLFGSLHHNPTFPTTALTSLYDNRLCNESDKIKMANRGGKTRETKKVNLLDQLDSNQSF